MDVWKSFSGLLLVQPLTGFRAWGNPAPPPQVFSVPINNVKKGRRVSFEGPTTPTSTWLWFGDQHGESLKDQ